MRKLSLTLDKKYFGHVCSWKSTDRVNMHEYRWVYDEYKMRATDYKHGDFLFHTDWGKKTKLSSDIFKCPV